MKIIYLFLFLPLLAFSQVETNYVIKDIDKLTDEMYANAKKIDKRTFRKKRQFRYEGNLSLYHRYCSTKDQSTTLKGRC